MKLTLFKNTIFISIFSVLGILISFISQLIIASYYGTSFERDAFFLANTIPNYIISIFSGSIIFIYIPKLVDLNKNNNEESDEFIRLSFIYFLSFFILVTITGILLSHYIVKATTSNYSENQLQLVQKLFKLNLPIIIFSSLNCVLTAIYQANGQFIKTAIAPVITTGLSFLLFWSLHNKLGIIILPISLVVGSFFSFIYLLPILKNKNWLKIKNFTNPNFTYVLKTSVPLIIIVVLVKFSLVIERYIASGLTPGSISILGYASQIMNILTGVTIGGIATILFPMLSRDWSENHQVTLRNNIEKYIKYLLTISVFVAMITINYSDKIIAILFERGNFTHESTIAISKTLSILMIVFVFSSIGAIIPKSFYIKGKTWATFYIGIFEVTTYLFASFILSKRYGYIGLAYAQLISNIISILVSIIFLHYILIKIRWINLFYFLMNLLLLIFILTISSNFISANLFKSKIVHLIFITCFNFLFYSLSLVYIFKIEEFSFIKKFVNNYVSRKLSNF